MLDTLHRRDLIKLLTLTSLASTVPRSAVSSVKVTDYPFTLGVASGSPRHNSVMLWTRLSAISMFGTQKVPQQDITLQWQVAHDEMFMRIAAQGSVQAMPAMGHAVHVDVQGLEPNRWYFYRFIQADHISPLGRTRTLAAPDTIMNSLRLAYASCQRWESGFYGAYTHMLKEQLDCVLFVGDYIYEYKSKPPNTGRATAQGSARYLPSYVPDACDTLADYRWRYAAYKSDLALQAMHAHCPWIITWDDHEVSNDYANDRGSLLEAHFMQRRAAAYQAFYEHMPLRADTLIAGFDQLKNNAELRIYGAVHAGKLAQFMVLDDRQYRDHHVCAKPGFAGGTVVRSHECPERKNEQLTLLGKVQEQWVHQAMAGSNAQWNFLVQQTLFGQRNFSPSRDPENALLHTDGWDGYPAARQRLCASIMQTQVPNPVFIGGDIHQNWVGHVKADYSKAKSKTIATEFCGTSISSDGGSNEKIADRLQNNPHYVFADAQHRGYGIVEIKPTQLNVTLRALDDVTRSDASISTLAAFTVHHGKPTIERA